MREKPADMLQGPRPRHPERRNTVDPVACRTGVVAIGRNEGERLKTCLRSIPEGLPVVYVDSGSEDDSVGFARSRGVDVVELDMSRPFTMARGRNAGRRRLLETHPELDYLQFLDGDCELREGWLPAAMAYLDAHPEVAVVCGRRRERHPEASVYNRLIDMEWDAGSGPVSACGGDALMRSGVLQEMEGFDEGLIAGEEPELCYRIRRSGRRIVRLDREMTLHDAAIYRLDQWWRRSLRCGHAYAELAWLHGDGPERFRCRELGSALAWGLALPLAIAAAALAGFPIALLALGLYAVPGLRSYRARRERGDAPRDAAPYALACLLGKFAEAQGAVRFAVARWLLGRQPHLIEYKGGVG